MAELIDRPEPGDTGLFETAGYVTSVWVEQEGVRDSVKFRMRIYDGSRGPSFETNPSGLNYREQNFFCYLDNGTHVALGQLQLLRDALLSQYNEAPLLCEVHFQFNDTGWAYFTLVRILAGYPNQTTVRDFFSLLWTGSMFSPGPWYVQTRAS